jgi:pyruvate/2-oxoglutarate dehydrogenase complex dihydrolipoamide dehydrogenase (E3) component
MQANSATQNVQQPQTQQTPHVREYDMIVIGSGQSGGPLATAMSEAGRQVALIERTHVGGSCVNVGCTPTKTMVASARVAYLARRSADFGVHTDGVRVEMSEIRARKRQMVESFRSGSLRSIEQAETLDLIRGEASFADQDDRAGYFQVEVSQEDGARLALAAKQVVINTGTRPHIPDLPGLSAVPYLDNANLMEVDSVPPQLLILGGGYIGLEFGQMFRRFGSKVTIVQRGKQVLAREDADIADAVAAILREDDIELLLEAEAQSVAQKPGGMIELQVQSPAGRQTIAATHLLVATGRQPNSDALQLQKAGVKMDERGHIQVNDRLETNVAGIYALGDVKGGPAFTHISYDDFRILRQNLIDTGDATTRGRIVPYTVYIDPELGRVGLSEEEAKRQGRNVGVAKLPMENVARALEMGETRGLMKAVVDRDTKQILGCAILGIHGGEVAAILQVAMMGQIPYPEIQNAIFTHPALAESLNNLFTTLDKVE